MLQSGIYLRMGRFLVLLLAIVATGWATPALADVRLSFHSFNGSLFVGRYPHAFIVLEGRLDSTGEVIEENYGFSAKSAGPSLLNGPAVHEIAVEPKDYIAQTNRHFSVRISDAQYRAVVAEMRAWRDAPGKYYDLDSRNCIHFVGKIAQMVGLTVDYPQKMLRRPKKWLNHIAALNPRLGAAQIK